MKLSDKLAVEVVERHQSCIVCNAINYHSDNKHNFYTRVNKIYSLTIGGMTISICKRCLQNLKDMITLELEGELPC